MQHTVFIPTRNDLEQIVNNAVTAAIAEAIPGAIRKATIKPWLTKDDLIDLTGWSDRTITHMRQSRQIPFSQHGRKILYPADGIEAFLRDNRIKTRSG